MNVGGISESYAAANFTNHSLSSAGPSTAWTVNLKNATFGSSNINTANNTFAYIDTASSMIELSQADYKPMFDLFFSLPDMTCGNSGFGKTFMWDSCFSNTTQCEYYRTYYASYFPDIVVTLDDIQYTIPSSAYLVDNVANNVSPFCSVMIQQTASGSAGIILGLPFLRQYYTYFDYD